MEWTAWNWINVFFTVVSALFAIRCFNDGMDRAGWINLFASSMNGAIVAVRLGF